MRFYTRLPQFTFGIDPHGGVRDGMPVPKTGTATASRAEGPLTLVGSAGAKSSRGLHRKGSELSRLWFDQRHGHEGATGGRLALDHGWPTSYPHSIS